MNEEWRVIKSKISITVEDGFLFCGGWNFFKSVSVGSEFIKEMRVGAPINRPSFDLVKKSEDREIYGLVTI